MVNNHLDPDLLSAYLDDEVTPPERARVETHLLTCAPCREELESLRWTVGLLQRMPPVELPRTFYLRETDVAPAAPRRRRGLLAWLQPLMAVSTAVSAVLFMIFLLGSLTAGGTAPAAMPAPQIARAPEESAREAPAPLPEKDRESLEAPAQAPEIAPEPTMAPAPTAAAATAAEAIEPTEAPELAAAPAGAASPAATAPAAAAEVPEAAPPLESPPADAAGEPAGSEAAATATTERELRSAAPQPTHPVEAEVEAEKESRPFAQPTEAPEHMRVPGPGAGAEPLTLAAFFGLLTLLSGGITLWLRRRSSRTDSSPR